MLALCPSVQWETYHLQKEGGGEVCESGSSSPYYGIRLYYRLLFSVFPSPILDVLVFTGHVTFHHRTVGVPRDSCSNSLFLLILCGSTSRALWTIRGHLRRRTTSETEVVGVGSQRGFTPVDV